MGATSPTSEDSSSEEFMLTTAVPQLQQPANEGMCDVAILLQQGVLPSPWVLYDYLNWSPTAWSLLSHHSPELHAWHLCGYCYQASWGDEDWAAFREQDPHQAHLLDYYQAQWQTQPLALPLPREGEPLSGGGVATAEWLEGARASAPVDAVEEPQQWPGADIGHAESAVDGGDRGVKRVDSLGEEGSKTEQLEVRRTVLVSTTGGTFTV